MVIAAVKGYLRPISRMDTTYVGHHPWKRYSLERRGSRTLSMRMGRWQRRRDISWRTHASTDSYTFSSEGTVIVSLAISSAT